MQYWENVRMVMNWQKLTNVQRDIIAHLLTAQLRSTTHVPAFAGNYTDLTVDMNKPKSHVPNVRKAAIDLENRGLLLIIGEKPTAFVLCTDWQEKLTDNTLYPDNRVSLAHVTRKFKY